MTRKFLLLNCDVLLTEWLNEELGGEVLLTRCHSLEDLHRHLIADAHQVAMVCQSNGSLSAAEGAVAHGNGHVPGGNGRAAAAIVDEGTGKLADQVDRFEQQIIQHTLARHGNHRKDTAAELGISRVTLYNKMKKFGMLHE
jgi:DNA-binding NtrC family response regulator